MNGSFYCSGHSLIEQAPAEGGIEMRRMQHERGEVQAVTPDYPVLEVLLNTPCELEWKRGREFQRTLVAPDSLCVFPPALPFHLRWSQPLDVLNVHLDNALLERTALEIGVSESFGLRECHFVDAPQVAYLCRALWAEKQAGSPGGRLLSDTLASALCVSVLTQFSTGASPRPSPKTAFTGRRFAKVREFIEAHLESDLSLEALAQAANMSAYHFARQFKAEVGVAPHQYVLQRRVERARLLLQQGRRNAAEVAILCGFCDQSHLTRHMKRLLGFTPGGFVAALR